MRLKAATLLESVVALSLLASIVSFAVLMQSRVIAAHTSEDKVHAWMYSEESLHEFRQTGEVEQVLPGEWVMEERIKEKGDRVWRVELTYYKRDVLVYQRVEYVQAEWN